MTSSLERSPEFLKVVKLPQKFLLFVTNPQQYVKEEFMLNLKVSTWICILFFFDKSFLLGQFHLPYCLLLMLCNTFDLQLIQIYKLDSQFLNYIQYEPPNIHTHTKRVQLGSNVCSSVYVLLLLSLHSRFLKGKKCPVYLFIFIFLVKNEFFICPKF